MSASLLSALVSVSAFVFLTTLFVYEKKRGARYLDRLRSYLDRSFSASAEGVEGYLPEVNSNFMRQLFHYVTHKFLAAMLFVLRRFEYAVEKIAQFNRTKAQSTNGNGTSGATHLTEIAKHKEDAKLSEKEKQKRRKEALEGG